MERKDHVRFQGNDGQLAKERGHRRANPAETLISGFQPEDWEEITFNPCCFPPANQWGKSIDKFVLL
jgi:hypothetical protein